MFCEMPESMASLSPYKRRLSPKERSPCPRNTPENQFKEEGILTLKPSPRSEKLLYLPIRELPADKLTVINPNLKQKFQANDKVMPKPDLMEVLQSCRQSGETFKRGNSWFLYEQITTCLRDYIKERRLYNLERMTLIQCPQDRLGQVFGVSQFFINELDDILRRHCDPVVTGASVDTCPANSTTPTTRSHDEKPMKLFEPMCGNLSDDFCTSLESFDSSDKLVTSSVASRGHLAGEGRSTFRASANLTKQFYENEEVADSSPPEVTSTVQSSPPVGLKRPRSEDPEEVCDSPKRPRQENTTNESKPRSSDRPRRTSLSLVYTDRRLTTCCVVYDDNSSEVESTYSVQSKVTATVKDSSDDLWIVGAEEEVLDTRENSSADDDDIAMDFYVEEYEVASNGSDMSDVASDDEDDFFQYQNLVAVLCNDSDSDYFADCEADVLVLATDSKDCLWPCTSCGFSNFSSDHFCDQCWCLRSKDPSGTQDNQPTTSIPVPDQERDMQSRPSVDPSDGDRLVSSQDCLASEELSTVPSISPPPDLPSSSLSKDSVKLENFSISHPNPVGLVDPISSVTVDQVGPVDPVRSVDPVGSDDPVRSVDPENEHLSKNGFLNNMPSGTHQKLCVICMQEPRTASLVHGSSGHQICCYRCALQLKRRKKPCPVCRRAIQKVITNFVE